MKRFMLCITLLTILCIPIASSAWTLTIGDVTSSIKSTVDSVRISVNGKTELKVTKDGYFYEVIPEKYKKISEPSIPRSVSNTAGFRVDDALLFNTSSDVTYVLMDSDVPEKIKDWKILVKDDSNILYQGTFNIEYVEISVSTTRIRVYPCGMVARQTWKEVVPNKDGW